VPAGCADICFEHYSRAPLGEQFRQLSKNGGDALRLVVQDDIGGEAPFLRLPRPHQSVRALKARTHCSCEAQDALVRAVPLGAQRRTQERIGVVAGASGHCQSEQQTRAERPRTWPFCRSGKGDEPRSLKVQAMPGGYWRFYDCRYHKGSGTCFVDRRPVIDSRVKLLISSRELGCDGLRLYYLTT
jgi:hypothetical protein